jgi:hypothetical protein
MRDGKRGPQSVGGGIKTGYKRIRLTKGKRHARAKAGGSLLFLIVNGLLKTIATIENNSGPMRRKGRAANRAPKIEASPPAGEPENSRKK